MTSNNKPIILLHICLLLQQSTHLQSPTHSITTTSLPQMLIQRLGTEAREILDSRADSASDSNRLSVPLLRREAPSATETSDITSLCSLSSQDYASLHYSDSQRKGRGLGGPGGGAESPPPPGGGGGAHAERRHGDAAARGQEERG